MNKLFYFVLLILVGCQNSQNNGNINILNDSLYKFHNVNQIAFPDNTSGYVALDSLQKSYLFKSYLENELQCISFGFDAYLVAKQNKIGLLTPIIVNIEGTDYSFQWLMLLDSNLMVISKISLGVAESGPRFDDDTTYTSWPENINYFFHDTIKTISLIKTEMKEESSATIVDSITYLRKILPNGESLTTKIDSSRYIKN